MDMGVWTGSHISACTIILGWGLVTYCACVNTVFAEKGRKVMVE